ncbi:hypothetical protein ABFU82_14780 [Nocardioides sp. WV_118_6]
MLGSQTLEVGIGLALLFFVLATAASAFVELVGRLRSMRAKDLEKAIVTMVTGAPPAAAGPGAGAGAGAGAAGAAVQRLTALLNVGRARTNASYVSAKAFADAVTQLLDELEDSAAADAVQPLLKRADTLARQARGNLTSVKAGLETWFDDAMVDVRATYQRYATLFVLAVGFVLAGLANASPVHVAQDLWKDSATREAVVAAAGATVAENTPAPAAKPGKPGKPAPPAKPAPCTQGSEIERTACGVDRLSALSLPVGWSEKHRPQGFGDTFWHVIGWGVTALLLMLGAPFWFDLLTRLVSARGARVKPASEDDGSHTALLRADPVLGLTGSTGLTAGLVDGQPEPDWLAQALNRPALALREPPPPPAPI